jgi:spore coat polysaccharide biosynthesis predicted glycosyltransferase SpsG
LVPSHTAVLTGPTYALLRAEFAQHRNQSLARRTTPQLKQLLITMGGVDQHNATGQVLSALQACPLPAGFNITVVMGPHAPWLQQVQEQAAHMPRPTQVHTGVSNMAQLMAESDLAIGAAGSTSWERCCLGLPTIQLVLAPNQQAISDALEKQGAAIAAKATDLFDTLHSIFTNKLFDSHLMAMAQTASGITNGTGAPKLATKILESRR